MEIENQDIKRSWVHKSFRTEFICRKCMRSFSPTDGQIKKHDWICRSCLRVYQNAKNAANPNFKSERKALNARPEVKARLKAYFSKKRLDPDHLLKLSARSKLNDAVKGGFIIRLPCSNCGNPKSDGHHHDYTKPLDVQWLCRRCHYQEDKAAKSHYEPSGNSSGVLATPKPTFP